MCSVRVQRLCVPVLLVALLTNGAHAQVSVRVGDVAHFKGPRVNRLQGLGLVVGLAGTGDGGDYRRMVEPLANWLEHYANPVNDLKELKDTKNVAVVSVTAELPEGGIREGDRVDVQIAAIGRCSSLKGGRLLSTPLQHWALVDKTIFGNASGPLQIEPTHSETVGTVRGGLVLERDLLISFMVRGSELPGHYASNWIDPVQMYVTLVIDPPHQSWGMAAAIAEAIADDRALTYEDNQLAMAVNMSNVLVRVPEEEAADPVPWLRDVMELTPLLPERGARILINRAKQIIVVDGEVGISPATFSVRGLTINIVRDADGQIVPPVVEQERFVAIDPQGVGGATLNRLVQQLNQIQVPIEDRINVIEELQRAGKIHARIVFEE